MNEEFQTRLRRLGVAKGVRHLRTSSGTRLTHVSQGSDYATPDDIAWETEAHELETLLPGGVTQKTPDGDCFVLDHVYPLSHRHGSEQLHELLAFAPAGAVPFCPDARLAGLQFRDFVFLDTETTGLGGAGALAFMVGAAFFEEDAFVVRQFFIREPADEPAMLHLLEELLAQRVGLITFNGQAFDVPLLDNRFLINRTRTDIRERPHLDLLPPSRRLWRNRLGSCALSALEQNLLEIRRTELDVPGWRIPALYREFVETGDAREMQRVFYHNRLDMLSMVSLATRVVRQLTVPSAADHPLDLLGLARWQADLGLSEEAEQNLRLAATPDAPTSAYHLALYTLGYLLKRQERREEALQVWQQIAATSWDDVTAHVELAKHYEWQERSYYSAIKWATQALQLVERWPVSERRRVLQQELKHRLHRLARKLDRTADSAAG